MKGHFFVFDGMDGAGKSTALQRVADGLDRLGHAVVRTREPGGSPLAEDIRACMLADRALAMPVETELLLAFAARAAHMHETVLPALARGCIVLCDRFIDSSHVYQGALGGCDPVWIDDLTDRCVPRLPELTFLFDLPVELARQRIASRGADNRFDRVDAAHLQRIREAFSARATTDPQRYVQVDASASADGVCAQIMDRIGRCVR